MTRNGARTLRIAGLVAVLFVAAWLVRGTAHDVRDPAHIEVDPVAAPVAPREQALRRRAPADVDDGNVEATARGAGRGAPRVIRGRLVCAGKPLPGWWISLAGTRRLTRSAHDGRFHFTGVEDGPHRIHVRDPMQIGPFTSATFPNVRPSGDEHVLAVTSRAWSSAKLSGRIVDPGGTPYRRLLVRLEQLRPGEPSQSSFTSIRGDGSFEFGPLPPGRYALWMRQPHQSDVALGAWTVEPQAHCDVGVLRR